MPDGHPGTALARYQGPTTTADLAEYAHLLAGRDNPTGIANGALPAVYRANPAALAFAVEYARALDVPPVTAITGIHIVDGKPTASAGLISALVRRAGHKLRIRITGTYEDNNLEAVCTIVRKDDPDEPYESRWTLPRAARANLVRWDDRAKRYRAVKERSAWDTYPENMLKARALTECARDAAEDALMGIHYVPEELGADVDESGEPVYTVTQVPPPASSAQRPSEPSNPPPASSDPQQQQNAQQPPSQPPPGAGQQPSPTPDPPTLAELVEEVLTAGDVEDLRRQWRRAKHYGMLAADVTDLLDVPDIDALTGGDGLPEEPVVGWLIQAVGRYVDHKGTPVRHSQPAQPEEESGADAAAGEDSPAETSSPAAPDPPADGDDVDQLAGLLLANSDGAPEAVEALAAVTVPIAVEVVRRYPDLREAVLAGEESGKARRGVIAGVEAIHPGTPDHNAEAAQ